MSNSWRRASLYGGALFFNSSDMSINVQRVRDAVASQQTDTTTDGQPFITTDGTTSSLDDELAQTIGRLVDDGTVVIDPENGASVILGGEEQKPDPEPQPKKETGKQKRARLRKEDPEYYKQRAIENLTDKRLRHRMQLEIKRKVPVGDGNMNPNDLIIGNNGLVFSTTDVPTSNSGRHNQNTIIFDKNFNEISSVQSKSHRFKRVYLKHLGLDHTRANPHVNKGVLLKRDVFVESRGRKLEIVRRNMPYHAIQERRKNIMKSFDRAERTINWLTTGLRNVFPEEDFDVFYPVNTYDNEAVFTIMMRFRDIEIKNSIEMTHQVGEMIVRMQGTCFPSRGDVKLAMGSSVHGTRMTFDITDAISNYQHSHLPSSMSNFNSFCTGDQYYGTEGRLDEIEFESLLHRLDELVRWESLEGGPHMRMENITVLGYVYQLRKDFSRIDNYTKRILRAIKQTPEKFDVFADCFSIYNDRGVVRFRVDKPRFYSTFARVIGKDRIKALHASLSMELYSYDESTNVFKLIKSRNIDSPMKMRKQAIAHMKNFRPIYMNGKYHRVILNTTDSEELINSLNLCPHPDVMDDIANHILFKLTEKLNEHGKTSE